jgi:uncharacterized membrane protein
MDLALLGLMLARGRQRARVATATAGVVGVTLLDLVASRSVSRQTPPVRLRRSLTIGKSADELFRSWREPAILRRVMEPLAEVTVLDHGRTRWALRLPLGRRLEWTCEVVEERPAALLRWRASGGAPVPHECALTFRPAPGNLGTEVSLQLALGPAALLPDLPLKMAAEKVLRRFKSLVETGELPTVAHNPSARART